MTLFIFFLVLLKSKREGKKLSGTLRMYNVYTDKEKKHYRKGKRDILKLLVQGYLRSGHA